MVDMTKTKTSTQTMIEGLPVILTTLSVAAIPNTEPKSENIDIQRA